MLLASSLPSPFFVFFYWWYVNRLGQHTSQLGWVLTTSRLTCWFSLIRAPYPSRHFSKISSDLFSQNHKARNYPQIFVPNDILQGFHRDHVNDQNLLSNQDGPQPANAEGNFSRGRLKICSKLSISEFVRRLFHERIPWPSYVMFCFVLICSPQGMHCICLQLLRP